MDKREKTICRELSVKKLPREQAKTKYRTGTLRDSAPVYWAVGDESTRPYTVKSTSEESVSE